MRSRSARLRCRWALTGLALWAGLVAARPARAEGGAESRPPVTSADVIGLLDVRVEGLSETATELFTKKIEESLEISGLKVASKARLHQYLAGTPWNTACRFGSCLSELRLRAAVATVIEVALATNGPSYHYVITLIDTGSGQTLNQLARKCDVCTTEEAFSEASLAIVELVNGVGDAAPPPAAAVLDPTVPAARVGAARRRIRWLGVSLLSAAVAAGATSLYLLRDDRDRLGAAAGGTAGALAAAGLLSLTVAISF